MIRLFGFGRSSQPATPQNNNGANSPAELPLQQLQTLKMTADTLIRDYELYVSKFEAFKAALGRSITPPLMQKINDLQKILANLKNYRIKDISYHMGYLQSAVAAQDRAKIQSELSYLGQKQKALYKDWSSLDYTMQKMERECSKDIQGNAKYRLADMKNISSKMKNQHISSLGSQVSTLKKLMR